MPRQKSVVPAAIRVRDNQRRSRARRTDLIDDLRRRLQRYEQQELQATLLMQAAARKVAWENTRLRELLVDRGVAPQEIDNLVHAKEGTKSKPTLPITTGSCRPPSSYKIHGGWPAQTSQNEQFIGHTGKDTGGYVSRTNQNNLDQGPSSVAEEQSIQLSAKSVISELVPTSSQIPMRRPSIVTCKATHFANNSLVSDTVEYSNELDNECLESLPELSDCFCPSDSARAQINNDKSMLEMSCETAAGIIAGMRGDGDMALARHELGCIEGTNCSVKNVHVLQVMETEK